HVDHGFTVNVAAPNGSAGTLLIDPPDVVIGDTAQDTGVTLSNSDVLNAVSALSAGATYLIAAGNFTLAQHGVIDTRVSGANSHSLDVEASNIEIDGVIDTRAYSGALVSGLLSASSTVSTANAGSV